jgi:hypothetical protein
MILKNIIKEYIKERYKNKYLKFKNKKIIIFVKKII